MELNSGLTAFADNQSDGSKSHIERYHRYDFDTKEESIEEIIVETNSSRMERQLQAIFQMERFRILIYPICMRLSEAMISLLLQSTATPYCSTVCLQITTNNGGTNYGSGL